jgi:hypothetical protein
VKINFIRITQKYKNIKWSEYQKIIITLLQIIEKKSNEKLLLNKKTRQPSLSNLYISKVASYD